MRKKIEVEAWVLYLLLANTAINIISFWIKALA